MPTDEQGNYFIATAAQYAPMATGFQFRPITGMEGLQSVPGFSNPLISMLAQPMLMQFMGASGMSPMGLNDRNVYDVMQNQRFWKQQYQLQQQVAELDRPNMMSTMRGIANLTGTPWGAEQMRAASAISSAAVTASPLLQMMAPDLMDQFGGQKGSAAVMASHMMSAGRYRIDPMTGQLGMEPAQLAAQARSIYGSFYGDGRLDLDQSKGFTAGQLGSLYEQMTLRGMLPGATGPRQLLGDIAQDSASNRGLLSRAAASSGFQLPSDINSLSSDQVQKLLSNSEVSDRMRSFDTDKVKKSLKSYLDTINAVKDIFGEMGRPNAPMAELLNAMEALTNGASSQINPGKLNTMVRVTQQLAQSTGIGLDAAMQLQQHVSMRTEQLGLDPVAAVGATQGAMAFRAAMVNTGLPPAWGRMNIDQLTQMDANLRANAGASRVANRMGLAVRLSEQFGGFEAGSEAQQYVDALKNAEATGSSTYVFRDANGNAVGGPRSLNKSQNEFLSLFVPAKLANGQAMGLNATELEGMAGQFFANQQYIAPNGLGNVARTFQRNDFFNTFSTPQLRAFGNGALVSRGISGTDADAAMRAASGSIMNRISGISPGDFGNDAKRQELMTMIFREEIGKTAAGQQLAAKMKPGDLNEFYATTAERFKGQWDETIRYDPNFSYLRNSQNAMVLFNKDILQTGSNVMQQELMTAKVRTALAPLNRGTMLQHVMSYLQNVNEGDQAKISSLVASAIGGVSVDDVRKNLLPVAGDVENKKNELDALQRQIAAIDPNTSNPEAMRHRSELLKQYNTGIDSLHGFVSKLTETTGQMGVGQDTVSVQETQRALNLAARQDNLTTQMRTGAFGADPDNRKLFNTTVADTTAAAADVAMKTLMGTTTAHNLGITGVEQAKSIRDTNQKLQELAMIHTGGDVGALIAGEFDSSMSATEKADLMNEVKGLTAGRTAAVSSIQDAVNKGGRQWDAETLQKQLKARGQDVSLEDIAMAKGLGEGDLGMIKKLSDEQAYAKSNYTDAGKELPEEAKKRLASAQSDVDGVMKRTGAKSFGQLQAAAGVFDKIDAASGDIKRGETLSGQDLAKEFLGAYGIVTGDTDSDNQQLSSLAQMMNGETGRAMALSLLSGEKQLSGMGRTAARREALGKYGDADAIDSEYGAAMKSPVAERDAKLKAFRSKYGMDDARFKAFQSDVTDLNSRSDTAYADDVYKEYHAAAGKNEKAFRSKYGLGDDKAYRSFQETVSTQERSGFSDYGSADTSGQRMYDSISKGTELFGKTVAGGQLAPKIDVHIPDNIKMTGELTIKGGTGTMNGNGSMDAHNAQGVNSPPTGGTH